MTSLVAYRQHASPMKFRHTTEDEDSYVTNKDDNPIDSSSSDEHSTVYDDVSTVSNREMQDKLDDSSSADYSMPSLADDDENEESSNFLDAIDDEMNGNAINDEMNAILEEDDSDAGSSSSSTGSNVVSETSVGPVTPDESSNTRTSAVKQYGGLSNLGNTCYMASALQMIASVDSFVDYMNENEPISTGNLDDKDGKGSLRDAFIDLVRRLRKGETVRPDEFKKAVDSRSSLFIGFAQQDSHEFLTTLLDLIDEDYKKHIKEAKKDESETNEAKDGEEKKVSDNTSASDGTKEESSIEATKMETESASHAGELSNDAPQKPIVESKSFSELDVNAIERLIHGTQGSRETLIFPSVADPSSSVTVHAQKRCKLAGGRMVATTVNLKPYSEYKLLSQEERSENQAVSVPIQSGESDATMNENSTPPGSSVYDESDQICSPVDRFFTTKVRVRLTCDSCKYSRSHDETYLHLSLEIGSGTGCVDEGLRRFFAPERRDIKCEKCFCETATQTTEITKLPRTLLLHFKRFIVDISPDYTSISYRKNQTAVTFDEELSLDEDFGVLSEFLAPDCILPSTQAGCSSQQKSYELRSIVNHIGSSASCGHYTADAKKLYSGNKRKWTRFNDSFVSSITAQEATEQSRQTAYLVLYELA